MARCGFRLIVLVMLVIEFSGSLTAQSLSQRLKSEPIETLVADARRLGNPVRGAIVFTRKDLGCTTCHTAATSNPIGPEIEKIGRNDLGLEDPSDDAIDAYLIESLLDPSETIRKGFESVQVMTIDGKSIIGRIVQEDPDQIVIQTGGAELKRVAMARDEIEAISPSRVSAMPDDLVDRLAGRRQFLDLIRYLSQTVTDHSSRTSRLDLPGGKPIDPELQGIVWLKEFNCEACHQDDLTHAVLLAKQAPDLTRSVGYLDPSFMERFIADPLHARPGTTMPDMMQSLSDEQRQVAAKEITHFLVSQTSRRFTPDSLDAEAVHRGRQLFHSIGCVACHSPRDDDGKETLIESSVPLGRIEEKYDLQGLVSFLEDPLAIRPSGRMPKMKLTHWEAIDLASYLLSGGPSNVADQPFELDSDLVAKGKARFEQLGCRQCHQLPSQGVPPSSIALSKVRPEHGCLSESSGDWPTFGLNAAQRQVIAKVLHGGGKPLSVDDQIAVTLTGFRCLNCHRRGELGGVTDARDPFFQTSDPNLGPQGRIPPTLTGIGAKLKPAWMRQVLLGGRTIRPYVQTRMPEYGIENVAHLGNLFHQSDRLPEIEWAEFKDQKEMRKIGVQLVGSDGLNCVACHTFQLKKAANMPAVDLTEMSERLNKTWFYHYMRDPQRLSPNTIMPSFWPGGRAMRTDILDGDRDLQIEAIWQYLLDGRQARMPRGVVLEPIRLLASDEAVMLRRSYPNVGKRGIGVGYPNQVNLVFDAEQMRLAMLWQGEFADPAGVWRSQGHGRVRPLGKRVISFAAGSDLENVDAVTKRPLWIAEGGRPPHHHFKGYSLDDKMRPRFKYEFDGIAVEDYFIDLVDASGRPFLRRIVKFKPLSHAKHSSQRSSLWFRVASGKHIAPGDSGQFVVDDSLRVHIGPPYTGQIAPLEDAQQLGIALALKDGRAELLLDYNWQ